MALKVVFLALMVYCASEAQSQGDDTSLPLSYNATKLQGDGATCPNDQLRQESTQTIISDVHNLMQKTLSPTPLCEAKVDFINPGYTPTNNSTRAAT